MWRIIILFLSGSMWALELTISQHPPHTFPMSPLPHSPKLLSSPQPRNSGHSALKPAVCCTLQPKEASWLLFCHCLLDCLCLLCHDPPGLHVPPWPPGLPVSPWLPELPAPTWPPGLPVPPWPAELPALLWLPGLPVPPWPPELLAC
ncbi:hypothetical protein M9458_033271 [Cirrhinus mrigala]|uniref:Uncharacterized protein n=1 Tax=Cirrhinus mrigala TaxID=683832 RepID=A0ABD0PGS1_CIRMR